MISPSTSNTNLSVECLKFCCLGFPSIFLLLIYRGAESDKVNPLSLILSAEMMLRHINWNEAADLLINSIEKTIQDRYVTYDFERLMDNASLVSCSGFAKEMIKRM